MSEKLKVAAYVRISADSEQMQHSIRAQEDHYRRWIEGHPDWFCAGIYADVGISGTGMEKRRGFQRMLSDCEAGKIDLILVKSVSRFARNTVDLLCTVRMLKSRQISVWFEEQEIDSLTAEGELLLTLLASVAQAESESISENIRWAIRNGFQKGIGNTKRRTFGDRWEQGVLQVIPKEAEAVRRIFANFLAGGSHAKIAKELTEEGMTSVNGNPISVSAVRTILRNPVYTGDLVLQKTFIRDPVSKKKTVNTGQLPQYIVQSNHEAIIDRERFTQVQERLAANKKAGRFPYNRTGTKYPFTGRIRCGCCGRHYTRQLWNAGKNGPKRPTWVCTGKKAEIRRCTAKNLSEELLRTSSAAVLGLQEFDEAVFLERVESITVSQEETELLFCMKDGIKISQGIHNR